jgi:very-short-patch-repair endonuclease
MTPSQHLAKETAKATREALELAMLQQLRAAGYTQGMVREHKFAAPDRDWRFDFAWRDVKIALEVEGGTWNPKKKSRHTTGSGFEDDCEKYAHAVISGWGVIRVTSKQVASGKALEWIGAALVGADAL